MPTLHPLVRRWLDGAQRLRDDAARSDTTEDRRASHWRMLCGAAFALAIAFAAIGYLIAQRDAALRDAEREVRNLSLVLADWIEDGFRAVEQLGSGVAEWMRAEGIDTAEEFDNRLATVHAQEALRARAAGLPRVDRLFLVDARGKLIATSAVFPAPSIDVTGRDYFQALHRKEGPDAVLSAPARNDIDGRWTVFAARRLRGPDGSLLGIVGAAIDLERFEAPFERLALGRRGSVALLRRDGLLLARHPWADAAIGTSIARSEAFVRLLAQGSGAMRSRATVDGVDRILGVQALGSYPLAILATRATKEVLAPWRREVARVGVAATALAALVLVGVLLGDRQARARAALRRTRVAQAVAEAELALSREREAAAREREDAARALAERDGALRAVFEAGTVGVAEIDIAARRFVRVNARYCAMTGRSAAELLGGLGPTDVVHSDDLEAEMAGLQAIDALGARDTEARYLRPDGAVAWVRQSLAISARDTEGRPTRCVAIVQDVTESRAAADRLRQSEALLRLGMEAGRIGDFVRDFATGLFHCGAGTRAMFGLPPGEEPVPPEAWMATLHPEDRDRVVAEIRGAIARRAAAVGCDYRVLRPTDGGLRHIEMRARYVYDAAGRPVRSFGVTIDVTERREAEDRLRASEEMLRLGMEIGHIGTFTRDAEGNIHCGAQTRALHGLQGGDEPIPTATWLATILPEDRGRIVAALADARERGVPEASFLYRMRRPGDGTVRHIEARARYQRDAGGRTVGTVGVIVDVTAAREAEALLRLSLEVGRIGTFRHDFLADMVTIGAEMRVIYGLAPGEAVIPAAEWLAPILPEDLQRLRAGIDRAVAGSAAWGASDYRILRPADGALRHVEARVRYEYDADGRPLAAVGVVIDVTERREAEDRIAHLAHHDTLTGLPNRALFRQRLDEALARTRRSGGFAVLCLDLDRFKEVNDTLGHPAGDALLRTVAERLGAEMRETDTLARLGGDEFAIVQSGVDRSGDTVTLARRLVEVLSMPFDLDGHRAMIGTSIGIAIAPQDGADGDALLKAADMALYQAKVEGRGTWRFFEPEMDLRAQMRRELEFDLQRALEAGEFEVHYQPIVRADDRQAIGLEALLRWRHPERGLVSPDRFIPLAEEIGLIVPLGKWVLQHACAEAARWPGALKLAVNLSPAQFASPGLVDAVAGALAEARLDPGRLELEITETVLLRDIEATLATMHRLKAFGVRIAMDDFGTGYSSLSYLQRFPFDKVKIDRSFTRALGQSRRSDAIVRAVTDLCRGLEMTTTAEGVETEQQFAALRHEGCDEVQGYLFGAARPAAEIPAMLGQLAALSTARQSAR
ncbi:bifunctional diguanylate cyclase/phosphodiesterase [Paracraurococcus lichenis]|uniref:EAL domain-containing protein n=1 Tax=Paracraurococcus lichenis TaxID=3064888 RepID=A0ABT9E179_9PROT|nr:EAL domain-containing protein [Paracraurococcus sp. LOR1-02]MDO9709914.1 EAL domain-containing protein [Paracraurococcus sp. LOR1-02]